MEEQIRAASPDVAPLPKPLEAESWRWLSAKSENRQQVFDKARTVALEEQVESVRQARDTASCTGCQSPFAFYWQTWPGAPRLGQRPSLCLRCHRKAEAEKAREKRFAKFQEDNPLAVHYLEPVPGLKQPRRC